jgi:hypothetical protein
LPAVLFDRNLDDVAGESPEGEASRDKDVIAAADCGPDEPESSRRGQKLAANGSRFAGNKIVFLLFMNKSPALQALQRPSKSGQRPPAETQSGRKLMKGQPPLSLS